ncbi:Hypothetical protein FKW44_000225, partial [Caligus rogercresseyi]
MKNREAYNKKVSLKKLHIGSMVYLWDPQTEENRKLATYFHGPYEVLEIINDRKVKIKIGESTKTVARNRLRVVNAEDISSETIPLNMPIRRDTKNLKESDDYNYDDERQRPSTRQTILVAAANPTFQPFNAIAHFQPEGQIATSLTMINVKVNLPINDIITEVEDLIQVAANETIRQSTFWVQNRTIMEINVIANDLRQSLRELKKISGISQRQRPKRQALVGLGLLGGWALKNIADGIFGHGGDHHYDIDMLKNVKGLSSKVQLMQTSLKHLANVEKEMLAKHHRTNYRLRQIENAENAISILESTRNR